MSARSTVPTETTRRPTRAPDPWTTAGAVIALGCTVVGTFVLTPWRSGSGQWGVDVSGKGGWAALGLLIAFVAVALVVVGLAAARARAVPPERAARRALALACVGGLTLLVFWTGAPAVLACGAAGLALDVRRRSGRTPVPAAVALVLAALTVAAALYLAVAG